MIKKFVLFSFVLLVAAPVMAKSHDSEFSLPADAVEVAPNVYSLGKAHDAKTHGIVEGYAIVHKKADAKNNPARVSKTPTCYGYLAAGAKWKVTPEAWQINATNSGLSNSFLLSNTSNSITKWENAASWNILGTGQSVSGAPTNKTVLDGINEVSFGPIANSNTIAVTTVWGYFSGPTFSRQLVEWDQVFNTAYQWSNSGELNKMDYENISTHELGHAIGMNDIYTSSCSQVTMYGYGSLGETIKRDLAQPDITGISALY